jgi:hypothetical protein
VDEEPLRRELEEIEEEEEEEEEGSHFALTDVVDREATRFDNHTCTLFLLAYNLHTNCILYVIYAVATKCALLQQKTSKRVNKMLENACCFW